MNELYRVKTRLARRANQNLLTVNADASRVLLNHAAKNFHQRGFARSVLSYQRDRLRLVNFQTDNVERNDTRKSFADSLHQQHWRIVWIHASLSSELLEKTSGA